jgi:hypothetical protein
MSSLLHFNRALVASIGGWLLTLGLLVATDSDDRWLRLLVLRVLAASLLGRIVDDLANPYDGVTAQSPAVQALFTVASSAWLLPLCAVSVGVAAQTSSAALALGGAAVAWALCYLLYRFQALVTPHDADDDAAARARPFGHFSTIGTVLSAPIVAAMNAFLFAALLHYPLVGTRCGNAGFSALGALAMTCQSASATLPTGADGTPGHYRHHLSAVGQALCDYSRIYGAEVFLRSSLAVVGLLVLWYSMSAARIAVRLVLPRALDRAFCEAATVLSLLWYVAFSLAEAPLLLAVFGGLFPRAWLAQSAPWLVDACSTLAPMRVAIDLQNDAFEAAERAFTFTTGRNLTPELHERACQIFTVLEKTRF